MSYVDGLGFIGIWLYFFFRRFGVCVLFWGVLGFGFVFKGFGF